MDNQTVFLVEANRFEFKDTPMPTIGVDDVLIKITDVTICGSDAHFFEDPTYGGMIVPPILPIVLGHECAGIVEEVGEGVTHIKKGDRVAVEPGAGCGKCKYCLTGHYNLCRDMDFMAAPPFNRGALSRYVSHPARMVFKLPENVTNREGALIEPLAVGMYSVDRSGAKLGMKAVVLGCGTIGLMVIASLKSMGVRDIIAVDLFDLRLENARKMGASDTINSKNEDLIKKVLSLTDGEGADLVYETAGSSKTAEMTIDLVRPGGKIVMVGNVHGKTPFRFIEANNKEVDILSVFRYVNIYPMAINAVSNGLINIADVISKVFKFEQTQEAFECAINEKDTIIKVLIEF